jgi:RNA polymerase sigma-70 factor, ECF subfamily
LSSNLCNIRNVSPVLLREYSSIVLTQEDTAALVQRALRGESPAFTDLVRGYLRPAYSVALSILGRPMDAEDVAQDSFMKAFASLESCREPKHFAAWLFQIVRNRARNLLEGRRLRDVASDEGMVLEFASPSSESTGMRDALLTALAALDEQKREVVLLHDLENWTHAEIAQALNIGEVHSRQHLFRARQILRAKLDGDPGESTEENHVR